MFSFQEISDLYLLKLFNKPGVMISFSDVSEEYGPAGRRRLAGVLEQGVLQSVSVLLLCILVSKTTGDNLH